MNHPNDGKMFDISKQIQQTTGVADASVKLFFVSGYGNRQILSTIYEDEKP